MTCEEQWRENGDISRINQRERERKQKKKETRDRNLHDEPEIECQLQKKNLASQLEAVIDLRELWSDILTSLS